MTGPAGDQARPDNARMLRRSLAIAIAQRPGGLLAVKVHLKHVSVATTKGYAVTAPRPLATAFPLRG